MYIDDHVNTCMVFIINSAPFARMFAIESDGRPISSIPDRCIAESNKKIGSPDGDFHVEVGPIFASSVRFDTTRAYSDKRLQVRISSFFFDPMNTLNLFGCQDTLLAATALVPCIYLSF